MRQHRNVLLLLIAANWFTACNKKSYEKPLVPVKVQAVEQYTEKSVARFSASILPFQQVAAAFRVGDYVGGLLQVRGSDGRLRDVQEGDWVARDSVLAGLRETTYKAKVNQVQSQLSEAEAALGLAQAQLAEAEVTRNQAKSDYERAGRLFETQSLTKPEFDAAKTRFEVTREKVEQGQAQIRLISARVEQAKAGLEEARSALQDCTLKAPISGTVLKKNVEPGSLAGPGTVGFILADTSSVKAVFGVPDVSVPKLKIGDPLTMTSAVLPGVVLRGRISRIAPSADPKSRVFDVETTIPNARGQLRVGMIASMQVDEETTAGAVPVIPLSAVVRSNKSPTSYAVYLVEEEGGNRVARLRDVRLGEVYGNTIAATSGLKIGDQVIVAGTTIVKDGERVQVIP